MGDPGPPNDLATFARALAAAEEIERGARERADALLELARANLATLDDAARRLRLGHPELSAKLRELRELAEQHQPAPPPAPGDLAAELEAAQKRLAIYESFEDTIQSVLSAAMREAHEIRTRSEEEAAALAARAAERGRVEEFPIHRPASIERDDVVADIERLKLDRAEMIRERDFQADEVRRLRAERDAVAQQLAGLRDAFAATLQQLVRAVGQPGTAPIAAAPAPAAAPPAQPAASVTRVVSPDSEVRVLISPVASFSGLVRLEEQLRGAPAIRSLYVRDLRNGIATLIVNVATAMPLQDLADGLARDLGASVERLADGLVELKLPAQEKDAGSRIG